MDTMEQYFEQPEEKTAGDIHPELRSGGVFLFPTAACAFHSVVTANRRLGTHCDAKCSGALRAHARTRTHTHAYTRIHTYTHTHTYTHIHTYTQIHMHTCTL